MNNEEQFEDVLDTKTLSETYSHNDPFGCVLIEVCNATQKAMFQVASSEIAIPSHLCVTEPVWEE